MITGPAAVTAQGDAGSVYTLSLPGFSGNTTVPAGTYNSLHPSYGSYFLATGSGSIVVAAASGFTAWANANGATGQTVAEDHDNDGVENGIEYFIPTMNPVRGKTTGRCPADRFQKRHTRL